MTDVVERFLNHEFLIDARCSEVEENKFKKVLIETTGEEDVMPYSLYGINEAIYLHYRKRNKRITHSVMPIDVYNENKSMNYMTMTEFLACATEEINISSEEYDDIFKEN